MTGKYSLALVLLLSGCDKPEPAARDNAELAQYLQRITGDLVFISGGTFWMGDFCSRTHGEGRGALRKKILNPCMR
ncbi:hypothetical protein NMD09_04010 [Citrobacter portucalensis]|uniref:hypothetical protein n=1 Tax=Citrobacter portucalensis TaxID=1639133 RepID=UPI00351D7CF2